MIFLLSEVSISQTEVSKDVLYFFSSNLIIRIQHWIQ